MRFPRRKNKLQRLERSLEVNTALTAAVYRMLKRFTEGQK